MTDAYGEYADVEAGERPAAAGCVDVNSCTPMRGAIQIESSLVACSYGFNSVGNTSPNIRMLTANHCNYNHIQNAYDYTFYHDGNLIGTEYAGEESMSGDFMKVPRSAGSAQRNWVYYTDAQQQYVINSVPGEASQNTGDPIHFSGYRHLGVDGEMLDVDICWWNDTPATRWSVAPRQARRCTAIPSHC